MIERRNFEHKYRILSNFIIQQLERIISANEALHLISNLSLEIMNVKKSSISSARKI